MKTLREILATEFIGAIVVAMLYVQAFGSAVVFVNALIAGAITRSQPSVFGRAESSIRWESLIPALTSVVLYAAAATAILVWLYRQRNDEEVGDASEVEGA